jgi:hypothetical protein
MPESSSFRGVDDLSVASSEEFGGDLTEELRACVKRELEPGERLLWAACSLPPPFRIGRGFLFASAIALFLFGSGFTYLAYAFAQPRAKEEYTPAGIMLLAFGCLFLIGLIASLISRLSNRRRTARFCNAVTDRRAIVWQPEPQGDAIRVQTVGRGEVRSLVRIERPDGSGTLEFSGTRGEVDYDGFHPVRFEHIPEVRRVEQIIRNNLMLADGGA